MLTEQCTWPASGLWGASRRKALPGRLCCGAAGVGFKGAGIGVCLAGDRNVAARAGRWLGSDLPVLVWFFPPGRRPALPLVGAIVGTVLAIPGLYFAGTLNAGAQASTIAEANRIQVFERLPHHLLPTAFQTGYVPRHLLLWALFAVLCLMTPAAEGNRFFRRFVAAAMGLRWLDLRWVCWRRCATAGCFDPAILLVPHDRHSGAGWRSGCCDRVSRATAGDKEAIRMLDVRRFNCRVGV